MALTRLAILSALIFVAIFAARYAMIDPYLYAVRDDGVITMSVGRNLVDYGFVGVSPSGPIVEASSSPVQMLTYAAVYAMTGIDYAGFALLQTLVAAACIGALFPIFLHGATPPRILTMAVATASLLTTVYPFFLWHGSGMENAITHVIALAAFAGLAVMGASERISYVWLLPFVLLPFVRFELLITTLGLLGFFSLWWAVKFKSFSASVFSGVACLFIFIGHAYRIGYFGSFFPNTKVAQSISLTDRISGLLSGNARFWQTGSEILSLQIVFAGWVFGLVGLALLIAFRRRAVDVLLIVAFLGTLLIAAALPFVLGPARIDPMRTMTHVSLLSAVILAIGVTRGLEQTKGKQVATGLTVSVALVAFLLQSRPYYLGWHTEDFAETRDRFLAVATEHDIHRPLVANPDLGVMTWPKALNVIDMGKLGTPAMAALSDAPGISEYFLDLTRPDLIEVHHPWIHRYCDTIFLDPRFEERYAPLTPGSTAQGMCGLETDEKHYWIRKAVTATSNSPERAFLTRLQRAPNAVDIQSEISECGSASDCSYILRTVYRMIPELRANDAFDAALLLFDDPLERAYLEGWRSADADAALVQHFLNLE